MERIGNYEIRKQEAQKYFLTFDQQALIEKFSLEHDGTYLYTEFVGRTYRIHRENGTVERSDDGFATTAGAGFEEVLSIFDLLCHGTEDPRPCGEWALLNSLPGKPRAMGVGTDLWAKHVSVFAEDTAGYCAACRSLGGIPADFGDIGFEIPIFRRLSVVLKFYEADDEFPAQLSVFWDKKSLEYLYYETAFYVMGHLMNRIEETMRAAQKNYPPVNFCGK